MNTLYYGDNPLKLLSLFREGLQGLVPLLVLRRGAYASSVGWSADGVVAFMNALYCGNNLLTLPPCVGMVDALRGREANGAPKVR